MHGFRLRLWLSGLAGLALNGLLGCGATVLVRAGAIRPPLPYPLVIAAAGLLMGGFSVAEIPMMVYAIRHLARDRTPRPRLLFGLNAMFVFFACVYGLPVLIVTGSVPWGLGLCALSAIRLAASLLFVHTPPWGTNGHGAN